MELCNAKRKLVDPRYPWNLGSRPGVLADTENRCQMPGPGMCRGRVHGSWPPHRSQQVPVGNVLKAGIDESSLNKGSEQHLSGIASTQLAAGKAACNISDALDDRHGQACGFKGCGGCLASDSS